MNNRIPNVVGAADFLNHLAVAKGSIGQLNLSVTDDVVVDGEKIKLGGLNLEGINFQGRVTVQNLHLPAGSILHFSGGNFQKGLLLEHVSAESVSLADLDMRSCSFWDCRFQSAYLKELRIGKELDVSGFTLQGCLDLQKTAYEELCLVHESSGEFAYIERLRTDDVVAAVQFQLAGVPVFTTTEVARQLIIKLPSKLGGAKAA